MYRILYAYVKIISAVDYHDYSGVGLGWGFFFLFPYPSISPSLIPIYNPIYNIDMD